MNDDVEPAFLAPLSLGQLKTLLANVDATLAEGRALRQKIVRTIEGRRETPASFSNAFGSVDDRQSEPGKGSDYG